MVWLHVVIDVPSDKLGAEADFWTGALGWATGDSWPGHPELRSFEPGHGTPYVHLQEIDGPPRVHLDIGTRTPEETISRATSLGATLGASHPRWQRLRSPGGFPFCVFSADAPEEPEAVAWPEGHRTRLVQVCIDSPVDAHDREVSFWRSLLPGRWVDSSSHEFAGKWHRDGSPVQLLFQRLDEPHGPVRAHLDLGTDDLAAESDRLRNLGAREIGPGRGWHALRDPAGLAFCATLNAPESTAHRDLG
jgi:hypothetical protein